MEGRQKALCLDSIGTLLTRFSRHTKGLRHVSSAGCTLGIVWELGIKPRMRSELRSPWKMSDRSCPLLVVLCS